MIQNKIQNNKITDFYETPLRLLTEYSDNSLSKNQQQVSLNKLNHNQKFIPFKQQNKTYKHKFKASPEHRNSNLNAVQQYINNHKTFWTENQIKTNPSIQRNLDKFQGKKQQFKIEKKVSKNYEDDAKKQKELQILKDRLDRLSLDNSNLFQDNKALIDYIDKLKYQKKILSDQNQKFRMKIQQLNNMLENQQRKSFKLLNQKNQLMQQYNQIIFDKQLLNSTVTRLTAQINAVNNHRQKQEVNYLNMIKQKEYMAILLSAEKAEKQCKIRQLQEIYYIVKRNQNQQKDIMTNQSQLQLSLKKRQQQLYQLRKQIIQLKEKKIMSYVDQRKDISQQKDRIIYNLKIIHESQMQRMQQQLLRCQNQIKQLKIKTDANQILI